MKKFLTFTLTTVLIYILCFQNIAYAAKWPETPSVAATGAVVIDSTSGCVLYSKNMNKKFYPASTTKIMTVLLALENSSLNETVTFSKRAISQIGTDAANLGMKPGEKITMKDAVYGAMLKSANEYCNAIGETVAGSIEGFTAMMNKRAKEIGCKNTHFVTTNGLHDENHYVSAYDLALITRTAMKNTTFRKVTSTKQYTVKPTNKCKNSKTFKNHHQLLVGGSYTNAYNGCIGGKTGFTNAASHTLVTVAKRDGMELICVVLKETSANGKASYENQYIDTKKMLDAAYSNFKRHEILKNEGSNITKDFSSFHKYFNLDTKNSAGYISIPEDSSIMLPNNVKYEEAKKKVKFYDNPDIKSGDNIIGEIVYSYNNKTVGKIDIIMKYYPKGNIASIKLPDEMKKYSLLFDDSSSVTINSTKDKIIQTAITVVALIIVIGILFLVKLNQAKKRRRNAYRSRRKRSRINFDNNDLKL